MGDAAGWSYHNPVRIQFGAGLFDRLPDLIAARPYALVTYGDPPFAALAQTLQGRAGRAVMVIDDIAPNPDFTLLDRQCARLGALPRPPGVIVALGGGSVIDSAKVLAAAAGDFARVRRHLATGSGLGNGPFVPIIAVPTTAGTGSEVTCWATIWDGAQSAKHSLAHGALYPETALVDPALMLAKPAALTRATALDALSHALESIWNVNANPVSARHAVAAARTILADLPALLDDLANPDLRARIAGASLEAGLAFSNTKTAIAHNLSYPVTLRWGVTHGIAASFTLPVVLQSVAGLDGLRGDALRQIFGADLVAGADRLADFLAGLGVAPRFEDHGVPPAACAEIVDAAFAGERGRNFIGSKEDFLGAADRRGVLRMSRAH